MKSNAKLLFKMKKNAEKKKVIFGKKKLKWIVNGSHVYKNGEKALYMKCNYPTCKMKKTVVKNGELIIKVDYSGSHNHPEDPAAATEDPASEEQATEDYYN